MAAEPEEFQIKIASASCNQTGGDWSRNIGNICAAIDRAIDDGADILSLEELGLTGYERGDDFYESDNTKTQEFLQMIAGYAASRDPNLVISVGHPWYFADKNLPDQDERRRNPIFNRLNNNFNVQTILSGGQIVSMSAKKYLFNYERGYEGRHFEEWSDVAAEAYENFWGKGREGTIYIDLPEIVHDDGTITPAKAIPFGSPVIQVGIGDRKANLFHIICEEYWIGSRFDNSADDSDFERDNPLARKSRDYDITVCVNANASPPAAAKIDKHYHLCQMASRFCQVFVHTDGLGSSGSTFAQFGSRLMTKLGKIISEGVRCSFKDMAYTSQVVSVHPPVSKGHQPHVIIAHEFAGTHDAPVQDGPAPWEHGPRRELEEEIRNEMLWLFDYMRKNKIQGITQALSGGADSAYNAAKLRIMIDLACDELGVEGFLESMSHLKCKDKILEAYKQGGRDAAVKTAMSNMLTCVYMGTDNSSEDTLRAAQTLVEGGVTPEGEAFEGIGGKFHYRNVQRLVDVYAQIFSGVDPGKLTDEQDAEVRKEIAAILRLRGEDVSREELDARVTALKEKFEQVNHVVLSVVREEHKLTYENIQARLRQVLINVFSSVEDQVAISNPNLDEGRNSYATWGGDLHGGMISGNAHKPKQRQLDQMKQLFEFGLAGIKAIRAFYWVNKNRPSAELQPKSKDGKVTQFDEDQLGRSFAQMDVISHYMLYDRPLSQNNRRNSPLEVFEKCRAHPLFANDDLETLHDRIRLSYDKWTHAQFKIHGSPVAATYGENVDHQSSMRTPNINSGHRPELAELSVHVLGRMAEREGIPFREFAASHAERALLRRALVDEDFGKALSSKMWTPDATDGRKMKIRPLFDYIREKGIYALTRPTKMHNIFLAASRWRREKAGIIRRLSPSELKNGT